MGGDPLPTNNTEFESSFRCQLIHWTEPGLFARDSNINVIVRRVALECIVAAISGGVAYGIKLKDASDFAVDRDLLERGYPAYKSFRGLMHSELMPVATMDDRGGGDDDISSYFFVLLRPDVGEGDDHPDEV
jgi:hypothetical protein